MAVQTVDPLAVGASEAIAPDRGSSRVGALSALTLGQLRIGQLCEGTVLARGDRQHRFAPRPAVSLPFVLGVWQPWGASGVPKEMSNPVTAGGTLLRFRWGAEPLRDRVLPDFGTIAVGSS